MAKKNGHGGTVTFASATIHVTDWQMSHSADALVTTDSASAGSQKVIAGTEKADFSFNGWYDSGTTTLANIKAGTSGAGSFLIGGTTATVSASILMTNLTVKNTVGAVTTIVCTATSDGTITI